MNRHPGQGTDIILLLVASGDPGKGQHGIGYSHQRGIGLSGNKEQTAVKNVGPTPCHTGIGRAKSAIVMVQVDALAGYSRGANGAAPDFDQAGG